MRPFRSLLIFILVVFIGGALLAPWLYWLVQQLAPGSHLAASPFHRYEDRAFLGLALAGIWPLMRNLGAKSGNDVGLVKPAGQWRRLAGGFALGFASLACVAFIVLLARGRAFDDSHTAQIAGRLLSAAATAIIVAALEEILFRGGVFGALRRVWDWRLAMLISSMLYAIVHFMKPADLPGPVTWSSGLQLLPQKLAGFGDLRVVVPGFFNLTLAGILLALAYHKTGNLYFSIGLHAGWILWLKTYAFLTVPVAGANIWFWGTGNPIDGWLALIILAIVVVILPRLPLAKSQTPAA